MTLLRRLLMGGAGGGAYSLHEQDRWVRQGTVLEPLAGSWEAPGILEPSVLYEDGVFKMWYRGGGLHASPDSQVGYATSSDGLTWTRHGSNPILGAGVGGEAANAFEPNMYHDGSTYYLYYNTASTMKVATSATGLASFTIANTGLSLPTGAIYFGNSTVWREGASWYMLFDAYLNVPDYWGVYYATSANGTSWTLANGGAQLTSLRIVVDGTYGSMHMAEGMPTIDGKYHAWYHASDVDSNIYSDIYHAYSTDRINWTIVTPSPILTRLGTDYEITQIADPAIIEVSGTSYMFYDADDIATDIAAIRLATFSGTLSQLVGNR